MSADPDFSFENAVAAEYVRDDGRVAFGTRVSSLARKADEKIKALKEQVIKLQEVVVIQASVEEHLKTRMINVDQATALSHLLDRLKSIEVAAGKDDPLVLIEAAKKLKKTEDGVLMVPGLVVHYGYKYGLGYGKVKLKVPGRRRKLYASYQKAREEHERLRQQRGGK